MPTDTIYGLVGQAMSKETVLRIYKLRQRNPRKPMIILLGSLGDLNLFGVKITPLIRKILKRFWPGKVSIILPCPAKKFSYLHRGTKTLAFRLPAKKSLRNLIRFTGPLAAPSANLEGKPPATTISQARKYFGGKIAPRQAQGNPERSRRIDFYVNAGTIKGLHSTLIRIKRNKVAVLRPGALKLKE